MVSLDLGVEIAITPANKPVAVPVTLTSSGSLPMRVQLELGYPGWQLAFVGARAAAAVEAEIKAGQREAEGGEKIVEVQLNGKRPIPQGVILNLNFQISSSVKVETEIKIRNLKQSAFSQDGAEFAARGLDGSVTLLEPIPACFFYMH